MAAGDLRVLKGPDEGAVIAISAVIVLGRDPQYPPHLSDPTVSSRHARVMRRPDGQIFIEDLGSRNGTLVNGTAVRGAQVLNVGDLIQIGNTELLLEGDAEPAIPPAPTPAAAGFVVPPPPGAAPPALATPGTPPPTPPPTGRAGPSRDVPSVPPSGGTPIPLSRVTPGPSPGGPRDCPPLPGQLGGGPPPGSELGSRPTSSPRSGRAFVAALAAVVLVGAGFAGGWFSRPTHSSSSPTSTTAPPGTTTGGTASSNTGSVGTVYVESNQTSPSANSVLAYSYGSGASLQPMRIAAYPTGGTGSANLTDNGTLDATGHITIDSARRLLFAVNQGSDTVAVFHIAANGALSPVSGSPFPSGGKAPVSVGINGGLVVVVNKAQDGIRNLTGVAPNYTTFHLQADGALSPTGHTVNEPPGSSPTQALITPDGHLVFGSEESGPFQVFLLGSDGSLAPGPGNGLDPPGSLFPAHIPVANRFGLGMSINPSAQILYAQLANANTLGVFSYESNGQLTFVGSVANKGGEEPCWSVLSADGSRLYVDDAANDTTSVFNTSNPRKPKLLQNYQLEDNGNPWDLTFDPSGEYIFVVAPRARQVNVTPGQGNQLHVEVIGPGGRLSETQPPVGIPVPLNTNPFGVAAIAAS